MLTAEIINNHVPRLQLQDSIGKALQLVNDFRVTHLPVVAGNIYLGMISEEDLLETTQAPVSQAIAPTPCGVSPQADSPRQDGFHQK